MKVIHETTKQIYYTNDTTKMLLQYCVRDLNNNTPPLTDCLVVIVEDKKTKTKTYVLYEKGEPIHACTQFDSMAVHIEVERFRRSRNGR